MAKSQDFHKNIWRKTNKYFTYLQKFNSFKTSYRPKKQNFITKMSL